MQFMLLVYRDETNLAGYVESKVTEVTGAFMAYRAALREAGVFVAGDRLDLASTATTVRITDGRTVVLDGPYAETKEQLGGFFIIDVPNLDAALTWAGRCPGAHLGTMEVRPMASVPVGGFSA